MGSKASMHPTQMALPPVPETRRAHPSSLWQASPMLNSSQYRTAMHRNNALAKLASSGRQGSCTLTFSPIENQKPPGSRLSRTSSGPLYMPETISVKVASGEAHLRTCV